MLRLLNKKNRLNVVSEIDTISAMIETKVIANQNTIKFIANEVNDELGNQTRSIYDYCKHKGYSMTSRVIGKDTIAHNGAMCISFVKYTLK